MTKPRIPLNKASLEVCGFPKYRGRRWDDIVKFDPAYVEWLLSMDGPPINDEQYEYLTSLLEEES